MSFATDKAAVLDIMRGVDCDAVERADTVLQSYANVPQFLFENTDAFDCNRPYMYAILDAWDAAALLAEDIYYNNTAATISNPLFVAKYTVQNIVFDAGAPVIEAAIMGMTTPVEKITISTNTQLNVLTIGNGAKVKVLETLDTACLFYLRIRACKSYVSELGMITEGSCITNIFTEDGAVFGGYNCLEITATCGDDVTAVTTTDITSTSITLDWTPPANTINTKLYYRYTNANDWIEVTGLEPLDFGNFFDTGYAFRSLRYDTNYDFKIVNICEDGLPSAGVETSAKTLGAYDPGP